MWCGLCVARIHANITKWNPTSDTWTYILTGQLNTRVKQLLLQSASHVCCVKGTTLRTIEESLISCCFVGLCAFSTRLSGLTKMVAVAKSLTFRLSAFVNRA